jgi:class 3 adenylate cyclase
MFRFGRTAEPMEPPILTGYLPRLSLEGLQLGVDNLRHDVHLSRGFVEKVRPHLARLIAQHGNVDAILASEEPEEKPAPYFARSHNAKATPRPQPVELKPLLTDLHLGALNQAKAAENLAIDMLARAAILKFLRLELSAQFAQMLERCRMLLRGYEGVRHEKALEYRERVAAFQVQKKIILRKAGQEVFHTLREIERETLSRTRRSLFGSRAEAEYKLFLNPLIFSEDGRDDYLNAQHYFMFGNFDRDPDRFLQIRRAVSDFLSALDLSDDASDAETLDRWLNVPDNAQELIGEGGSDESTPQKRSQAARLQLWVETLESEEVMDHAVAGYEVLPLLPEYSPFINPQQLKNALISKEERGRVERLIADHGRLSGARLFAAVERVENCRGAERSKVAVRFLRDFMRYHRDYRRLAALNAAMDSANLIGNDKMRELSAMNSSLYEFVLRDEHAPAEEKIVRHVILKADVRDSSRLTRSLLERGLNPASYFSLNFYDPVNKLLAKYGAAKVFLEGDAIILALLERQNQPPSGVARACVLAREIIEIVRGYNQLLGRAGLPALELGIGISFQDSAPMYLLDGDDRIMISDALNESDRLASCSKRIRKNMQRVEGSFNVYALQSGGDAESAENPDDFMMSYNVNGIRMSEAAFRQLGQEISLEPCRVEMPPLWGSEEFRLHSGLVPLGGDIFRKIVVRASRVAQIDAKDFSLTRWTERWYYEVCTNPAVYAPADAKAAGR